MRDPELSPEWEAVIEGLAERYKVSVEAVKDQARSVGVAQWVGPTTLVVANLEKGWEAQIEVEREPRGGGEMLEMMAEACWTACAAHAGGVSNDDIERGE